MSRRFPDEFALAVLCCAPDAPGRAEAAARLAETVDWRIFLAMCRRHRIESLAWRSIERFGLDPVADVARLLKTESLNVAVDGMSAASLCLHLRDEFERERIPILFVKGLTLSHLAYANAFVKFSRDVDILVPPADVDRAGAVLASMGFDRTIPRRGHLAAWHRVNKESVWTRPDSPTIELHSRLADNQRLIPSLGNDSRAQLVEVAPGVALPTLATDDLLVYLSVHGASSAWFRLKWIADFAALLADRDPAGLDRLAARARILGAGRAFDVALSLASDLFGTPIGRISECAARSPASRLLLRASYRQLLAEREPTERFLGTASIHLSQLLLMPGLSFAASEFVRQSRSVAARG